MELKSRKTLVIVGVTAAAALIGSGVAIAAGGDDDATDTAIHGSALQKATDAALAETGEGHVTGTEVNDEESYYEVEVTLDDGSQVDVQLSRDFTVVSADPDHEADN